MNPIIEDKIVLATLGTLRQYTYGHSFYMIVYILQVTIVNPLGNGQQPL